MQVDSKIGMGYTKTTKDHNIIFTFTPKKKKKTQLNTQPNENRWLQNLNAQKAMPQQTNWHVSESVKQIGIKLANNHSTKK